MAETNEGKIINGRLASSIYLFGKVGALLTCMDRFGASNAPVVHSWPNLEV